MNAEEESGFSFVDKRHTTSESEPAESPAPSDAAPQQPESAAAPEDLMGEAGGLPSLSVRERILMCFDILHQGAWIALGLVADPATNTVTQNLDEARTAIDCVAYLAEQVEPSLDDDTRREIKRVVADLRLNFVRQSQK